MKKTIDDDFIKQVYKTSVYIWAFGVLVTWSIAGPLAAIGWTLGSALSVGILCSVEWIVKRAFVPEASDARGALAKFSLIKLLIIMAVLSIIILAGGRNFALVGGFCAGVVLTQGVIFLKTLGTLISQRSND